MNNETGSMRGREISLIDLIVEILLHWRSIIAVMLVGGILMGAFGYAGSVQSAKQQLAAQEAQEVVTEESLRDKLTEEQKTSVDLAFAYHELYKQYADQAGSFVMDDFAIYTAHLSFWVADSSGSSGRSGNIATVYKNLFASEGSALGEINALTAEAVISEQSEDSNVVLVTVRDWSREGCEELAAAVVNYVEEQHQQLKKVVGSHKITLLNQSIEEAPEEVVLDVQRSVLEKTIELKNTCAQFEKDFSDAEKVYYDYLITRSDGEAEEPAGESEAAPQAVPTPGVSIKYVLLGMILFAFMEVFLIFLVYILNNKLRATDNLQEVYGIAQLGSVESEKRKKVFGFMDALILKLRYRGKRRFTKSEAINLATVAVKMTVQTAEAKVVCLVGCDLKETALEVCECVKESLEKEGITVQILNNVLYDAEAMEHLSGMQGAVLVETSESTLYEEIVAEKELLARQSIPVLGGIVVGR